MKPPRIPTLNSSHTQSGSQDNVRQRRCSAAQKGNKIRQGFGTTDSTRNDILTSDSSDQHTRTVSSAPAEFSQQNKDFGAGRSKERFQSALRKAKAGIRGAPGSAATRRGAPRRLGPAP